MAKCKSCNTNIPEGKEYCSDCQEGLKAKANESYLDSLLNSVKNSPSTENIYKKKNNTNENVSSPDKNINQVQSLNLVNDTKPRQKTTSVQTPEIDEDDFYRVDFSDLEDFDQFNLNEDLVDIDSDIIINDEDLFGESLSGLLEDEYDAKDEIDIQAEVTKAVEAAYSDDQQVEQYIEEETLSDNFEDIPQTIMEDASEEAAPEELITEIIQVAPESIDRVENSFEAVTDNSSYESSPVEPSSSSMPISMEEPQDEYSELSEDTDIDLDLDELLNSLNTQSIETPVDKNMADLDEDMFSSLSFEDVPELMPIDETSNKDNIYEPVEVDQDDFLSLLGQVSDDDSSAEDIRAISDMLSGNGTKARDKSMPSNVGEVFSDALKAVSSLNDYELEEEAILGKIPEQEPKKGKQAKKKKLKKEKIAKGKPAEEKPKLSLFQRLFGNVKDDKTAIQFKEEQRKLTEPATEKSKKVKGKKGVAPSIEEDEDSREQKGGKDKSSKKADKKEKTEKKKKVKEVIEVIDEIDEDPGRINRVGAVIVFFFFGIIASILILGTNLITYTLSIQHAANYFDHRKYTQAYNEVYGVDIRDEDIGLYDKIQTVMFVNKQLNSYNNYYAIEKYPEALDSLLKGLSRYEKYIELATMLGIESDLDYVRSQILAELSNVFNLTEEEAMKILSYDNMEDYSLGVYDVVFEKMNN